MNENQYTNEMICRVCNDPHGVHYTTHKGVISGCAARSGMGMGMGMGMCSCAMFRPTPGDLRRLSMQEMLDQAASVLREEMGKLISVDPAYSRLGVVLELVRDTLGLLEVYDDDDDDDDS